MYLVYNYNTINQQCIHNAIINLGFTLLCIISDDWEHQVYKHVPKGEKKKKKKKKPIA